MTDRQSRGTRRAGLFDLRLILTVLFAIYGVIVLLVGLLSSSDDYKQKTGDINVNLWMGIAMLVVAGLFGLWTWLRPIVIPPETGEEHEEREEQART